MSVPMCVCCQSADALTAPQEAALNALEAGSSFQDAAAAAGVNRTTLYRWTRSNPAFRAAYGEMEEVTHESARHDLVATATASVDGVVRKMKEDVKFAFSVIKSLGWLSPVRSRPVDVGHVCQEIEVEKREREFQLRQRLARATDSKASRPDDFSQVLSPADIDGGAQTLATQPRERNDSNGAGQTEGHKELKPQTRPVAVDASPAQASNQSDATPRAVPVATAPVQLAPHRAWTLEHAKALVALEKNPDGEGKDLLKVYMAQVSALAAHGAVTPQRH